MATAFTLLAALGVLLLFILRLRMPAFLALLLVSLGLGLARGMEPAAVLASVQSGMGGTLGFVAVVVGLGAMLGCLLEHAGGVQVIARALLRRAGTERTPTALTLVGLLLAIPVFFDVAFIILVPMLYSLARAERRSVLYFAMPLLAGLIVAHGFIPPTPGPLAVAGLLGADLGLVILLGLVVGVPSALLAGPFLCRRFRARPLEAFLLEAGEGSVEQPVLFSLSWAFGLLLLPLLLIMAGTVAGELLPDSSLGQALAFLGHPFVALLLACLAAWLLLQRAGVERGALLALLTRALEPAGVVVLVTGAGGVFKQVLSDSGVGEALTAMLANRGASVYLFGFLVALLLRVSQGSATVAMITAAGLVAPLAGELAEQGPARALLVLAIAAGGTTLSHVNDSGFWLVSRYLHLDEAATLRSWTLLTLVAGLCGLGMVLLLGALL